MRTCYDRNIGGHYVYNIYSTYNTVSNQSSCMGLHRSRQYVWRMYDNDYMYPPNVLHLVLSCNNNYNRNKGNYMTDLSTFYSVDTKTTLQIIEEAEENVRNAKEAYIRGDFEKAKELLTKADTDLFVAGLEIINEQ